ncbi:MAG: class I SAM-dependent methyltransferase [Ignavibacteriales bacterium]|nr:class I SAM-dependent methyltransferase [Ignavibacteriales bacterium]
MHYDPVKNVFAAVIKKLPFTRVLFYKTLDLMFLRSWYVRRELRKLREKAGSKKLNIYDAGSGFGQYTHFMAKNMTPCDIYSVDVKEEWMNDCREFFGTTGIKNVTFGVEDLTRINHKERFDLIVCVDVMEHIAEDVTVFHNFYNALKPGGYVLINSPSIYGGSDVHGEDEESFIGEHARDGYSQEELTEKMEPLGFSLYQSKYTYGFWGDKAWRLGIKYPMLMLNASKAFFILLPFYYLFTLLPVLFMMYADYSSDNEIDLGLNYIAYKK